MYFLKLDDKNVVRGKLLSDTAQEASYREVEQDDFYDAVVDGSKYEDDTLSFITLDIPEIPKPFTGANAIDAMSPEHANNPDVDVRDIVRIMMAPDVRCVKSKLKRVADVCGVTVDELVPGISSQA